MYLWVTILRDHNRLAMLVGDIVSFNASLFDISAALKALSEVIKGHVSHTRITPSIPLMPHGGRPSCLHSYMGL
jgi:hypothetical protein